MNPCTLENSYRRCEDLARASNFYRGLRLLPPRKRRALTAVYAFMRLCDDISDNDGDTHQKRQQFAETRELFDRVMSGAVSDHPILPALQDTVCSYRIPLEYFHGVIEGTEMDLTTASYPQFKDLYHYCYHVASIVGLICIHVFGFREPQAKEHAVACGIAFQLTNILRDIWEDLQRGRLYLPLEDLCRFNYSEEDLRHKVIDERFRALMSFEVERAHAYYAEARPLLKLIERDSRPAFWSMFESYHTILCHIEKRGYDVLNQRVRLRPGDKWRIALKSLLQW